MYARRIPWAAILVLCAGASPSARALASPATDGELGSARDAEANRPPVPTSVQNAFELDWLPGVVVRRELGFSPRWQRGAQVGAVQLGYRRDRAVDAHRLNVEGAFAAISSGASVSYFSWPDGDARQVPRSTLLRTRLRYGYLRRVSSRRFGYRIGPEAAAQVDTMNWYFGSGATFGYYASLGLRALFELRVALGWRHAIELDVGAPLFAWIARSPYALNDDAYIRATAEGGIRSFGSLLSNGRGASWGGNQDLYLSLRWLVTTGRRVQLLIGVRGHALHDADPRSLVDASAVAMVGFRTRSPRDPSEPSNDGARP